MPSLQETAQPLGAGGGVRAAGRLDAVPAELVITDKTEADRGQTALWVGPWPDSQSVAVSRWVVPAQVSTKISTTWSNSPRSDLQLEPGGGAAAEDKASSPSPWPDLPPTIPVNTASRS